MPETTTPDEPEQLKTEIKELRKKIETQKQELRDAWEDAKEANRAAENADAREDSWLREKAELRARSRRRNQDAIEKAAHETRLKAIRALKAMLPAATAQAKKGKPGLLRLILRATK